MFASSTNGQVSIPWYKSTRTLFKKYSAGLTTDNILIFIERVLSESHFRHQKQKRALCRLTCVQRLTAFSAVTGLITVAWGLP